MDPVEVSILDRGGLRSTPLMMRLDDADIDAGAMTWSGGGWVVPLCFTTAAIMARVGECLFPDHDLSGDIRARVWCEIAATTAALGYESRRLVEPVWARCAVQVCPDRRAIRFLAWASVEVIRFTNRAPMVRVVLSAQTGDISNGGCAPASHVSLALTHVQWSAVRLWMAAGPGEMFPIMIEVERVQ